MGLRVFVFHSGNTFGVLIFDLQPDSRASFQSRAPARKVTLNASEEVNSASQWLGRTMAQWTKDELPPPRGRDGCGSIGTRN